MRAELEDKLRRDMTEEARSRALAEAAAHATEKLQAIAAEEGNTAEERAAAEAALAARHAEIGEMTALMEKEMAEQDDLQKKIKAMESKVLVGGENLLEKHEALEAEAAEAEARLAAQKAEEAAAAERIKALEEEAMDFDTKYGSVEEEVTEKSKRLKKLYASYQQKKSEVQEVQDEFQAEKDELLEQIRILTQQIKLKDLVIASFIPPDYQARIMQHCQWSDYEEAWAIDAIQHSGNYVRARKEKEAAQAKDRETEGDAPRPEGDANGEDIGVMHGESAALSNVYFSYKALDEELYTADGQPLGRTVGGGRPPSARAGGRRPGSSAGRPGSARPKTNGIGSLRDSVADLDEDAKKAAKRAAYPEARGLNKGRR